MYIMASTLEDFEIGDANGKHTLIVFLERADANCPTGTVGEGLSIAYRLCFAFVEKVALC